MQLANFLLSRYEFLSGKEISTGVVVNWLPVSELAEYNVGICEEGFWVVKSNEGIIILDEERKFGHLISMLELPQNDIIQKLIEFGKSVNTKLDAISSFPFKEIVTAGFTKGSDYWAKLAFVWYDELSVAVKKEFSDTMSETANATWASQNLRQKAKRELKKTFSP